MESLIEIARKDLAQYLSIEATAISLFDAKEVVWADASLGYPQPGVVYAQNSNPGYMFRFDINLEKNNP